MFLFSYLLTILPPFLGLPSFSHWSILAFCTPMMASDSSFSLTLFKSRSCSEQLTTLMEGDAIISEAIAVLIFKAVVEMQFSDPWSTILYCLQFTFFTILLGLFAGFTSSLLLRSLHRNESHLNLSEVTLSILVPIMAYMLSDGLHLSSSIVVRICGIYMARYSQFILTTKTYPVFSFHSYSFM